MHTYSQNWPINTGQAASLVNNLYLNEKVYLFDLSSEKFLT